MASTALVRRGTAAATGGAVALRSSLERATRSATSARRELRAARSPEAAILPAAAAAGGGAAVALMERQFGSTILGFDASLTTAAVFGLAGWLTDEPLMIHAAGGAAAVYAYKQASSIELPKFGTES